MIYKSIVFILASSLLASCNSRPSPTEDLPPVYNLDSDPDRMPRALKKPPGQVSVRHILCAYKGAKNALRKIKLTRAEAKTRAEHILKLARAKGQDFAGLAKRYSDDANTSLDGGDLGVISRVQLHPDLEKAAFGLGPGQVSPVTESPRGFHILQRHASSEFQAAEIVVTYPGARESNRYQLRTPRTKEEARALTEQIRQRVLGGSSFYKEAIAHSDLFNHPIGGVYPIFKKGTYPPQLEEIISGLGTGEVSGIIETETGFHIVKRLPIQRIQIRQIPIEFRRPGREADTQKRSQEEARLLAHKVRGLALEPDNDFAALAAEYSDGPAANRGGKNEPFGRGQRTYVFDRAAFSLEIGEISEVIEAEAGFIIIKRIR